MSKTKHTPGPYIASVFFNEVSIQQDRLTPIGDRPEIAIVPLKSAILSVEEQTANAHLLAAAPEMFEALEAMLLALDGKISVDTPDEIKQARVRAIKALAKQKGKL